MNATKFFIYKAENKDIKVDVLIEDETVWLTQEQMSEFFDKSRSTINEHIKNIYAENELEQESSMKKFGNSEFAKKPTKLALSEYEKYRVKQDRDYLSDFDKLLLEKK